MKKDINSIIKENINRVADSHPIIKKNINLVTIGAVLAWAMPEYVHFFTRNYNYFLVSVAGDLNMSRALLLVLLFSGGIVYFFYKELKAKGKLNINVAHIFFAISVALDMILFMLKGLGFEVAFELKFDDGYWSKIILPFYPIIFYGIYFLLNRTK